MKETVFTPKYNSILITLLGIFLMALGGGVTWGGVLSRSIFLTVSGSVIVLLTPITLITIFPRLIVFRENEVVVMRPLSPDTVMSYKNFTGMDKELIGFGTKGIPLTFLKNTNELHSIFSKLMGEHKIVYSQNAFFDWWLILKAFRNAWVIYWGTSIVFLIVNRYLFDIRPNMIFVVGLALFFVVFFGNYYLFKRNEEKKRKRNIL